MGDTKTEILEAAKTLLSIKDNESDSILNIIIDEVCDAVLSYCRIDVLPRQLVSFIPSLAAKRYLENGFGGVKSVSEGERRVEYGAGGDALAEYAERLKPFVSRAAYVPSELCKEEGH